MPRPKQEEHRPDLAETIKTVAYRQMAEKGASALSLRSVARELGITAPAIYNYYPRRDDLVTALIVDAYTSLGDSQRAALTAHESADLSMQFSALGLAYRQWAITYPQRYQLIFGTPIPNYSAPADITIPSAAWALQPLIGVLHMISLSGRLSEQSLAPLSPALSEMLADWQAFIAAGQPTVQPSAIPDREVLYLALVTWSRVHGLVMLEIGGQLPSFIRDPGEIFRREIQHTIQRCIT